MTENKELTRYDILIESEIEVADDNPDMIVAYVGVMFNVDDKFGLNIQDNPDAWLNMYAKYDVSEDILMLECVVCADEEDTFEYEPTENETELIKAMLEEKLREYYDCTPQEFCESERGMRMSQ